MAKRIPPISYLSGSGDRLEIADYYIYEVSVYKLFKGRSECLGSKFYKSNVCLQNTKPKILKKTKTFILIKYIDWIGAPEIYIKKNYLKEFELFKKKRKNERKS